MSRGMCYAKRTRLPYSKPNEPNDRPGPGGIRLINKPPSRCAVLYISPLSYLGTGRWCGHVLLAINVYDLEWATRGENRRRCGWWVWVAGELKWSSQPSVRATRVLFLNLGNTKRKVFLPSKALIFSRSPFSNASSAGIWQILWWRRRLVIISN
jgi:hypothetical protein